MKQLIQSNAVYTSAEVKQLLSVKKVGLYKLVKSGKLKPSILGNKYLFTGKDILDFLQEAKTA